MPAAAVQLIIGLILLAEGVLTIQEHPHTARLRGAVHSVLAPLLGEEYEVPAITIGIGLILLSGFALVNAVMIFGALYGFWVV